MTVIVKAAHVRLCHSRMLFVRCYPRETQEMVFDAHDRALVVGLREGHDDADRNYRQTRMLLGQHPDLAGIYNIGGAADGVSHALKEMNRAHDVVFIGHGLMSDTRSLLIEGTMDAVITQNQLNTMIGCVGIFNNLRGGKAAMHGIEAPRSEIIFRENIPEFGS
jgi:LacI family transcriptional regulator